jgi:hypothetical protein
MTETGRDDWAALRGGLLVVAALAVAAVAGWGVHTLVDDPPSAYERTVVCLERERGLTLEPPRDPIARSADGGAIRTVVEGNAVTISISSADALAERVVENYRSVAGDLGPRLERRGHNVYLWDNDPSPSQRQTLFDCAY